MLRHLLALAAVACVLGGNRMAHRVAPLPVAQLSLIEEEGTAQGTEGTEWVNPEYVEAAQQTDLSTTADAKKGKAFVLTTYEIEPTGKDDFESLLEELAQATHELSADPAPTPRKATPGKPCEELGDCDACLEFDQHCAWSLNITAQYSAPHCIERSHADRTEQLAIMCRPREPCEYEMLLNRSLGPLPSGSQTYSTLEAARRRCDVVDECGGIVQVGTYVFELRCDGIPCESSNNETLWRVVNQTKCHAPTNKHELEEVTTVADPNDQSDAFLTEAADVSVTGNKILLAKQRKGAWAYYTQPRPTSAGDLSMLTAGQKRGTILRGIEDLILRLQAVVTDINSKKAEDIDAKFYQSSARHLERARRRVNRAHNALFPPQATAPPRVFHNEAPFVQPGGVFSAQAQAGGGVPAQLPLNEKINPASGFLAPVSARGLIDFGTDTDDNVDAAQDAEEDAEDDAEDPDEQAAARAEREADDAADEADQAAAEVDTEDVDPSLVERESGESSSGSIQAAAEAAKQAAAREAAEVRSDQEAERKAKTVLREADRAASDAKRRQDQLGVDVKNAQRAQEAADRRAKEAKTEAEARNLQLDKALKAQHEATAMFQHAQEAAAAAGVEEKNAQLKERAAERLAEEDKRQATKLEQEAKSAAHKEAEEKRQAKIHQRAAVKQQQTTKRVPNVQPKPAKLPTAEKIARPNPLQLPAAEHIEHGASARSA